MWKTVSGNPGLIQTSRKIKRIVLFGPKEKDELRVRLQRDGMSPEASGEERERHLWGLLQHSESSLSTATEDLQTLRTQQASEMREVGSRWQSGHPREGIANHALPH